LPLELKASDPGFEAAFQGFLGTKRDSQVDVSDVAAAIIADVRARGDAAVLELTGKYDRIFLTPETMRVDPKEILEARARCAPETLEALSFAARRIEAFHVAQMPTDLAYDDADGVGLGLRWRPLDSVGLYVPGGTAAYPSSVLMNAIPARVAGVERRVITVPTPDGVLNPLVLAAAELADVTEIYRIGGAQAIAALAYGTGVIPAVDKVVGPGNAFVAAAKRLVFGKVGIDSIAGPSEILIVADADNNPDWIAIDLLSQAEHDPVAQAILITDDAVFAARVAEAVHRTLETLSRSDIASASWRDHGATIIVDSLDDAPALVDRLAPEHLELAVSDPEGMATRIRHAGAIFLGRHTPEAIGDYVAGPNHVLPTDRTARFSSGLSVMDFLKRTTWVRCDAESLSRIGPAAITLAKAEGLEAHAQSIATRLVKAR
jgi:histidinol dehydrogenase